MSIPKLLPSLFVGLLCLTSCNNPTPNKPSKVLSDTAAYAKLQAYRQNFWDSLPKPKSWTNDYEGLYSFSELQKLNSVISAFEKETTTQICIVTLDTSYTSDEKFDPLALHIAKTWGVGQQIKNNGVLICICKGYKKIRICNGYGIEKILSDEETKEIMDQYFIPAFKKGKYFEGTFNGVIALVSTLRQKMK